MSGVNKVILIGRLGQDPEMNSTNSGTKVATVSIATSEKWKDKNGETQEATEWHRCVLWDKKAELAEKYLAKGKQVYFEGKLQTRQWEDQQGNKRYTTEVVVNQMQFLGDSGGGGNRPPAPGDEQAPPSKPDAPSENEDSVL